MKVVISSGHGKFVRGASGYIDEVDEARLVVEQVADNLRAAGVDVKTYHDDVSHSQSENLERIVDFHNAQTRDLDASCHFNAFEYTQKPMGVEVLYVTQEDAAYSMSAAIAAAGGFIDRGPKKRTDLYFLNNTAEPAILIETCFVDSKTDVELYQSRFNEICRAIANDIAGSTDRPPVRPPSPEEAAWPRPTIGKGDYGYNVRELQAALQITVDGDFGQKTANAVQGYQARERLSVDGVVGPDTWGKLQIDFALALYPPPMPPVLNELVAETIANMAVQHPIANYVWRDRGQAPSGYVQGIALAYAQAYLRLKAGDPIAMEMAKADSGNEAVDALAWYEQNYMMLGMRNDQPGHDTLRHLFVLLMGLGMRESSGQHCCGRDQSADNVSAETAEAGLYQTSWNASNCCTDIANLFDQYRKSDSDGYIDAWSEDVECPASDWQSYGSGDGFTFQEMTKRIPTFAVETAAITLRNLRQHYGPINRKEAELQRDADDLFLEIELIVDRLDERNHPVT